jgi:putative porin
MLHRFTLLVCMTFMTFMFSAAAFCADEPTGNGRIEIVEAITTLFAGKGVLTAEEKAAFDEKLRTPQPAGKDLAALIELMKGKGVINDFEAEELLRKVGEAQLPGEDIDTLLENLRVMGTVTQEEGDALQQKFRATPLGREKEHYDAITARIAAEVRKEMLGAVKRQISEESAKEAKETATKAVPEWTRRLKWYGDLRLRFEGDFFDQNNAALLKPDNPTQLMNTTEDRNRFLLRARLGLTAKVNDVVEATIGLATGTTNNPVSTNVTLGDFFNKKTINLDLGYMKWTPLESLTLFGGRFPSPWFATDMVWDPDLNFDGIAVGYTPRFTSTLSGFATAGAFPLQEVEFSQRDKWLFGGQVGVTYQPSDKVTAKLAVAYYDYENIVGEPNDVSSPGLKDYTAPQFQQKGNTLFDIDPSSAIKTALASDFRELSVTGSLDLGYWHPVHVVLLADYVDNLGFNRGDVAQRTGNPDVESETVGYQFGVTVGHPTTLEFGTWKGYLFYKHLEADAVLDAFTDSDFHLGGTNARGWIVGGDLGLRKNFWVSARWLSANEISGPPLGIDVFQLNLNAKF